MNGNDVKKEVESIELKFNQWLNISNLSEKDFLSYRTNADFEILSGMDSGYKIVVIGYMHNGNFVRIGEQFAYPENDLSGFEDLALLLLFMAQKLDSLNAKAPMFEQRPNYFHEKVQTFIANSDEYKKLMEQSAEK